MNVSFDLKSWRTARNMTGAQLAHQLDVSKPQIWRLEKEGKVPVIYLFALKGLEVKLAENGSGV